jgi:hypothetical protein
MIDNLEKLEEAMKKAEKLLQEIGATLTTEQRKKLKSSTYCGPNRSFPIPDCVHVRAAKVYLNRSNFSTSVKQKIAACINRKAKALGCPGTKPAKVKASEDWLPEEQFQQIVEGEEFAETRALLDEASKNLQNAEKLFEAWFAENPDCCK